MGPITIWKHFHHLREVEINNLWERSKVLGVFIGVLYAGYGYILMKIIEDNEQHLFIYNIIALAICILGVIFSVVWILMGKASKAWYEIYEKRIMLVERFIKINDDWSYNHYSKKVMPHINNCILNTKAGAFSPSKINIFIGIIMFWGWIVPAVCHFIKVFIIIINCSCLDCCCKTIACCGLVVGLISLSIFLYYRMKKSLKSSFIKIIK